MLCLHTNNAFCLDSGFGSGWEQHIFFLVFRPRRSIQTGLKGKGTPDIEHTLTYIHKHIHKHTFRKRVKDCWDGKNKTWHKIYIYIYYPPPNRGQARGGQPRRHDEDDDDRASKRASTNLLVEILKANKYVQFQANRDARSVISIYPKSFNLLCKFAMKHNERVIYFKIYICLYIWTFYYYIALL